MISTRQKSLEKTKYLLDRNKMIINWEKPWKN